LDGWLRAYGNEHLQAPTEGQDRTAQPAAAGEGPVVKDGRGSVGEGDDGTSFEWALKMRRLLGTDGAFMQRRSEAGGMGCHGHSQHRLVSVRLYQDTKHMSHGQWKR